MQEACCNSPQHDTGENVFVSISNWPAAIELYGTSAVNIKASLSHDDLARACADAMWKEDQASKGLGIEVVEVGPGRAVIAMSIQQHMVNGHGIAHGGFIFTVADSAFAYACNTYNARTVASQGNITFVRPGKLGDRLVATAREISRNGRSGIYDVRVTVGDDVIAEFRGHSRTVSGTWLPILETSAMPK